jgi:hypothetical protein
MGRIRGGGAVVEFATAFEIRRDKCKMRGPLHSALKHFGRDDGSLAVRASVEMTPLSTDGNTNSKKPREEER